MLVHPELEPFMRRMRAGLVSDYQHGSRLNMPDPHFKNCPSNGKNVGKRVLPLKAGMALWQSSLKLSLQTKNGLCASATLLSFLFFAPLCGITNGFVTVHFSIFFRRARDFGRTISMMVVATGSSSHV